MYIHPNLFQHDQTLLEFLTELSASFDEFKEIAQARDVLTTIMSTNEDAEMPLDEFHRLFSEHFDLVLSNNETLFEKVKLPLVESFDMAKAYSESDKETQDAIWGYIQQLTTVSVMLKTMTPDLVASIGAVAESSVSKIRGGTLSEEDAKSPMTIMNEISKNPDIMKAINEARNK